ncbi:MAG: GtrA family protein [Candidatus Aenigmatarchaeota archaeon]
MRHRDRFPKYCMVGATGVVVNEGLLYLLTEFLGIFYLFSSLIAIEVSIISNFLLNEFWTFSDLAPGHKRMGGRLVKFNLVSAGGLLINILVLFILTSWGLHYLVSNLAGIGAAVLWNYLMNLSWTWGKI